MTKITVGISDAVTGHWYILFPALILSPILFLRWKKTDRGRVQWDSSR